MCDGVDRLPVDAAAVHDLTARHCLLLRYSGSFRAYLVRDHVCMEQKRAGHDDEHLWFQSKPSRVALS